MKIQKYRFSILLALCGVMLAFVSPVKAQKYDSNGKEGRFTLSLSGDGWFLWRISRRNGNRTGFSCRKK